MTIRFARVLAPALLTVLAACGVAAAGTIFLENTFQTTSPQSIYGPGAPASVGVGPRFDGFQWNVPGGVGGIDNICVLNICGDFGQEVHASTSGKVGFTSWFRATAGEVTATIPVKIGLGLPSGPILPGQSFTVSSSYAVPQGLGFSAASPQIGAGVDFNLGEAASFGGSICVGSCATYGDFSVLDIHFNPELIAFNRDFDNQLRVFGVTLVPDLSSKDIPISIVKQPLDIDDVTHTYTLGRVEVFPFPFFTVDPTGSGPGPLSGSGSADVIRVVADATNIVAYLATLAGTPIPPLNASLLDGLFSYNVLKLEAGLAFGMRDSFTLVPNGATVDLLLEETGQHFMFEAGESVGITFPAGLQDITLKPTIRLDGPQFTTDIDMLISPVVDFSALGVSAFFGALDLTLFNPPAYHLAEFPINLWSNQFQLGGFADFTSDPIHLEAGVGVPAPATLILLVAGLLMARLPTFTRRMRRSARARASESST